MKISIGITHFNRPELFNEVIMKLGNLPSNFSLCIVDDCSEEKKFNKIKQILKSTNLKYNLHRHANNMGPGAAKNSLFEFSDTEYVFVLDSDNGIDVNSLQYIHNYASEHESAILAPASIRYFFNKFNVKNVTYCRKPFLANLNTFIFGDEVYNNGNMLILKNVWKEVGGYPVHHTLDTQGFGFRLRTHGYYYDCVQGASYYHRRHKEWRHSRFMQTSKAGNISIEQLLILLEKFSDLPPFIQSYIANYSIFKKSEWYNSLFSDIEKLISTFSEDENVNYEHVLLDEVDNFLYGKENRLLEIYKGNQNKIDFYELILMLGEGFYNYETDKQVNVVKNILKL